MVKQAPVADQERETRERILDAAHAVFLRRGTAGARTQEIADEAGVNKALLHYYFRSKEGLAEAVLGRAAGQLFPRVFQILGSDAPLDEKVRVVVRTYVDFLSERPYLAGYVLSELHFHPERIQRIVGSAGPPPLDVLRRQLREGAAAGTLRRIAPEQFVLNLVSLVVFPFAARPILDTLLGIDEARFAALQEDRKRHLADFFLNALRP